jgi:hypothetical protein
MTRIKIVAAIPDLASVKARGRDLRIRPMIIPRIFRDWRQTGGCGRHMAAYGGRSTWMSIAWSAAMLAELESAPPG